MSQQSKEHSTSGQVACGTANTDTLTPHTTLLDTLQNTLHKVTKHEAIIALLKVTHSHNRPCSTYTTVTWLLSNTSHAYKYINII